MTLSSSITQWCACYARELCCVCISVCFRTWNLFRLVVPDWVEAVHFPSTVSVSVHIFSYLTAVTAGIQAEASRNCPSSWFIHHDCFFFVFNVGIVLSAVVNCFYDNSSRAKKCFTFWTRHYLIDGGFQQRTSKTKYASHFAFTDFWQILVERMWDLTLVHNCTKSVACQSCANLCYLYSTCATCM